MKKDYEKPEVIFITLQTEESIAHDDDIADGVVGIESSLW